MKKIIILMVLASLLTLIETQAFAQGDAVSAFDGQIIVTETMGEHFSLRSDGLFGDIGRDDFQVGTIHLFTRDPDLSLPGLTGAYAELENVHAESYGLEAETYMGMVPIAAAGEQQTCDVHGSAYGSLDLHYHPQEDLMDKVGASVADENDGNAHTGAEYQIVGGLVLFTDVASGEDGFEHTLGGLRYYFGGEKSLVNRHREDVFTNNVLDSVIADHTSARSAVLTSDIR